MNRLNFSQRAKQILINYWGYFALGLGVFVITISLLVAANTKKQPNETITNVTSQNVLTMTMPVSDAPVAKWFDDSALQYNQTLNQWEAHLAVDFNTVKNAKVYSVLDGTVTKVYSNYLDGTVVEIKHSDTLTTVYSSLDAQVKVKQGDSVKKGDQIGVTSESGKSEQTLGSYLSFQVKENDKFVDPSNYLNLGNK